MRSYERSRKRTLSVINEALYYHKDATLANASRMQDERRVAIDPKPILNPYWFKRRGQDDE